MKDVEQRSRGRFSVMTAISVLILFSCALLIYCYLFRYSAAEQSEYRKLIATANPKLSGLEGVSPYAASQKRRGISKQLFFIDEGRPLELILHCSDAELTYENNGSGGELVEQMSNLCCYQQEALCEEQLSSGKRKLSQVIRTITAERATYSYQRHELIASEVTIASYEAPGHQLTASLEGLSPTMEGRASSLTLKIAGGELAYSADDFQAIFSAPEGPQ